MACIVAVCGRTGGWIVCLPACIPACVPACVCLPVCLVGVNGGSTPPIVPKIFKWLDLASGTSVVAMWHPYGYGGFDINSVVSVRARWTRCLCCARRTRKRAWEHCWLRRFSTSVSAPPPPSPRHTNQVPGLDHAIVFDWNGDNAGPYSADTYSQHFQQIGAMFPGATVWGCAQHKVVAVPDCSARPKHVA
jgi:hypothetical protein